MVNIRTSDAGRGLLGVIAAAALAFGVAAVGMSVATAGGRPGPARANLTEQLSITAKLGASRPLPRGFYGINYDYGGASVYVQDGNGKVDSQLAAVKPGTLRWPGGTGANYFQWRDGYPVPETAVPKGKKCPPSECEIDGFRFTLAVLAAAYRSTRATPIFDLNIMTSTLAQQIDMLKAARTADKLPVKYVELGNEFYLPMADYIKAFPTAAAYGKAVAADVKALHKAFPGVLVAAVGSSGTASARAVGWNAGMLKVATGAGKPDAVTLHDHPTFDASLTTGRLPALFTEAYTSAANISRASKELRGAPAWITEYGLSLRSTAANPAQLTYANALFEGAAAVLLAQQVSDAKLVNFWAAYSPNDPSAYTTSGLTPDGLAMSWLDDAAYGARTATRITFPGGPVLATSGDPALVGESFSGGTRGALLVNFSGSPVTVAAGNAIPTGARYCQATGNPVSQIPVAGKLTFAHGTTGRALTLPRYSITVVGGVSPCRVPAP